MTLIGRSEKLDELLSLPWNEEIKQCVNEIIAAGFFFIFSLVVLSVQFAACSAATNEPTPNNSTQTVSSALKSCQPKKGYDTCTVVSDKTVMTWRESLKQTNGKPPWRTISTDKKGNPVIELDPAKLNSGLIPTADGKGHYESRKDFIDSKSQLLGIDIRAAAKDDVHVTRVQLSRSQKFEVDNDKETVRMLSSTGDFVVDNLTTDDGAIYIDGKRYDLPSHESTFTEGKNQPTTSTNGVSTMSYGDNGYLSLAAGNWTAKLTADFDQDYFPWFNQDWFSAIYDFKRNGHTTTRDCAWYDFFEWGCETHRVKADEMRSYNAYVFTGDIIHVGPDGTIISYGGYQHEIDKTQLDVLRLSTSDWLGGSDYTDMCTKGRVEDGDHDADDRWGYTTFSPWPFAWQVGTTCPFGFPEE